MARKAKNVLERLRDPKVDRLGNPKAKKPAAKKRGGAKKRRSGVLAALAKPGVDRYGNLKKPKEAPAGATAKKRAG
jgi:hypothetical protein